VRNDADQLPFPWKPHPWMIELLLSGRLVS
jgi:hypothetical protein